MKNYIFLIKFYKNVGGGAGGENPTPVGDGDGGCIYTPVGFGGGVNKTRPRPAPLPCLIQVFFPQILSPTFSIFIILLSY